MTEDTGEWASWGELQGHRQKNMSRCAAEERGCMAVPVPETDTREGREHAGKRG